MTRRKTKKKKKKKKKKMMILLLMQRSKSRSVCSVAPGQTKEDMSASAQLSPSRPYHHTSCKHEHEHEHEYKHEYEHTAALSPSVQLAHIPLSAYYAAPRLLQ